MKVNITDPWQNPQGNVVWKIVVVHGVKSNNLEIEIDPDGLEGVSTMEVGNLIENVVTDNLFELDELAEPIGYHVSDETIEDTISDFLDRIRTDFKTGIEQLRCCSECGGESVYSESRGGWFCPICEWGDG